MLLLFSNLQTNFRLRIDQGGKCIESIGSDSVIVRPSIDVGKNSEMKFFTDVIPFDIVQPPRCADQEQVKYCIFIVFNFVNIFNNLLLVFFLVKILQILNVDQVVLNYLACVGKVISCHSQNCNIHPLTSLEFPSVWQDECLHMLAYNFKAGLFWKVCLILLQQKLQNIGMLFNVIKQHKQVTQNIFLVRFQLMLL